MKNFLLATVALFAVGGQALAADMAVKAPAFVAPAAAPLYRWTGFYIGGHLGGAFRNNNDTPFGNDNGRFLGGVQVGADYQFSGSWLVGAEAQYSFIDRNNDTPFAFPGGSFDQNLRGLASVTGRVGYTWGPGLIYFKGGYAYADMRNTGFGPLQFSDRRNGYTVGGGLEYMFTQNWSGKIEYQYFEFGHRQLFVGAPLVAVSNWREEEHTIKVGLNYRFNSLSLFTARY